MSAQIKPGRRHGNFLSEKNGDWEENSQVPVVARNNCFTRCLRCLSRWFSKQALNSYCNG